MPAPVHVALWAALGAGLLAAAAACAERLDSSALDELPPDASAAPVDRQVVPSHSAGDGDAVTGSGPAEATSVEPRAALDPQAAPQTPLGELRSRYLPVWSADFDWAFPPQACGSAWELDAIAAPVTGVNVAQYGDALSMAALGVMRYEHLASRALADPTPLAQLCVAVASVGNARTEMLEALATLLRPTPQPAPQPLAVVGFPESVTVVAVSPSSMLAVACFTPRAHAHSNQRTEDRQGNNGSNAPGVGGHVSSEPNYEAPSAPAKQGAYLLKLARGLEDRVIDISYRVAEIESAPAPDCSDHDLWAARWADHVVAWQTEGQVWTPLGIQVDVASLCPTSPNDCPRQWLP